MNHEKQPDPKPKAVADDRRAKRDVKRDDRIEEAKKHPTKTNVKKYGN